MIDLASLNLDSLTTEERRELYDILKARDTKQRRNRLGDYAPYVKQKDFHAAGATFRERLFMAGNQLGKTWAGAFEVAGPLGQLTAQVSTGYGFAAIIVAWLGRLTPLGCVLASFFMSLIVIGGELSQSRLGLPGAITMVLLAQSDPQSQTDRAAGRMGQPPDSTTEGDEPHYGERATGHVGHRVCRRALL